MNDYSKFAEIIKGKNILYIPIVSCINRDTQEYNLSTDGNVNRFITTFSLCNTYNKLTIILPSKHIKGSEKIVEDFAKCNNVELTYCVYFGEHAGEQRNNDFVVNNLIFYLMYKYNNWNFDYVIFESQLLGINLNNNINSKFIFWNPVSKVNNKTRNFLEGYDELNKSCFDLSEYMIIASPDQYNYYKEYKDKILYLDKLIDRDLSYFNYIEDKSVKSIINENKDKTIFYLPYRLSDSGYKIEEVINFIESHDKYIVLYSDPNNCHLVDNKNWIRVSSDRNTYYTIIDSDNIVIPYFEDIEFINHAAIHEFINKKCKATIYLLNQYNNPYNINNYDKFINLTTYDN